MLLKRAYTRDEFERMLAETDFEGIGIKEDRLSLEVSLERA